MQLGFIGTGTMGHAMARCLLEAGHTLTVYDRRRDTTANLCAMGAGWGDHPCRAVFSGEFTAGGTLDIVAKDVHLACELARQVGAPAHLGLLADDALQRAQAQGWGQQGFPIVARILEAVAGHELRAPVAQYDTGYSLEDPRR